MVHAIASSRSFGLARTIGVLYVLVIVLAGFSQGFVRASLIVADDAVSTAANITANSGLFKLGLITDLSAFIIDAIISVLLYQLFRPYGKTMAMLSAALRLIAHPAIASLNLLNHYLAHYILIADAPQLIELLQAQNLSLMFMEAHRIGYLIAGAFFGVHCFLLGLLILRSGIVPKLIGALIILASGGYLLESFGDLLYPGNELLLANVVGFSAAAGEVSLALYWLIKGQKMTQ